MFHNYLKMAFLGLTPSLLWASQSELDLRFLVAEREQIACQYLQLATKDILKKINLDDLEKYFGIKRAEIENCDEVNSRVAEIAAQLESNTGEMAYPNYFNIGQKFVLQKKLELALKSRELYVPFQTNSERKSTGELSINPLELEKFLRNQPISSSKECPIENELIKENIYNLSFWKEQLHLKGYDCAVKQFYAFSQSMNASSKAQETFENQLLGMGKNSSQRLKDFAQSKENFVSPNHVILFYPPLGYDLPSKRPREQLTVEKWKKPNFESPSLKERFEKELGIKFELIERDTLENINSHQIPKSMRRTIQLVEHHVNANASVKFIVIGRSMGAYVAREVLEKLKDHKIGNRRFSELVDSVLLIGGTPWGSVIADYKSRVDQHDEIFSKSKYGINSLVYGALKLFSFIDIKDGRLKKIVETSRVRKNIESMSHRNFDAQQILDGAKSDYKVLNVIFLKPEIKKYFENSPHTKEVDLVFLQWAMYGPTEGSAPLSHSSWDTQNSKRVFVKSHNHLGFWNLTPDEGLDLIVSAIKSAKLLQLH